MVVGSPNRPTVSHVVVRQFVFWRFVSQTIAWTFRTKLVVAVEDILSDESGRRSVNEVTLAADIGYALHNLKRHDFLKNIGQFVATPELQQDSSLVAERLSAEESRPISALQCNIDAFEGLLGLIERVDKDVRLADRGENVIRMALEHLIEELQRLSVPLGLAK